MGKQSFTGADSRQKSEVNQRLNLAEAGELLPLPFSFTFDSRKWSGPPGGT
jgi:hypothetical protein